MRRAVEMLGQSLGRSIATGVHLNALRLSMSLGWNDAVRFVLEQAAWNFATKRALLTLGAEAGDVMPGGEVGGIVEGYSVDGGEGGAETPFDNYAFAGYQYAWYLPDDYLHKTWIKESAASPYEIAFQLVRDAVFTNIEPCTLEYIAEDEWTTNPENWPETFKEVVAARLANIAAPEFVIEQGSQKAKVSAPQIRDKLDGVFARALYNAKNKDAAQQGSHRIPPGRFVLARRGSNVSITSRSIN